MVAASTELVLDAEVRWSRRLYDFVSLQGHKYFITDFCGKIKYFQMKRNLWMPKHGDKRTYMFPVAAHLETRRGGNSRRVPAWTVGSNCARSVCTVYQEQSLFVKP